MQAFFTQKSHKKDFNKIFNLLYRLYYSLAAHMFKSINQCCNEVADFITD